MMTTSYDPEADAMFIRLGEKIVSVRTEEVAPGVLLDFDPAGRVVGIEVLDVRARMTALTEAA